MNIKYQHLVLKNNNILTICSYLDKENSLITFGYSIFNSRDKIYKKKVGNALALERLQSRPLSRNIPKISNVYNCDIFINRHFISWLLVHSITQDNDVLKNKYDMTIPTSTYHSLKCLEFYLYEMKLKPHNKIVFEHLLLNMS